MSGRLITRKEQADATKEYLSHPHPSIELDRGQYLLCHCKEFHCKPHRAHFHELMKFNDEASGVFAKRRVATDVTGNQEMAGKSA